MTKAAVLGVDIGTSSSKAVLVDLEGVVLGSAVREHVVDRPRPGWVEMAAEIWWEEFCSLSEELSSRYPDTDVVAVGVSGMGPCVALADASNVLVRPAILYGIDTRAGAQIERLNQSLGAHAILERGGSALSTQAAGPKIAWIAETEPGAFSRARRLFMPASWLAFQLTGEYVLDHQSASQCAPLYDGIAQDWYRPWAEPIMGDIELPRLVWADTVIGTVTVAAAITTGIPAGVPVIAGTIDAWSEAVGVGAQRPGDLMLMYGTTMFLINTVTERVTVPELWGTMGAFENTRSLAGGMATSGAITGWLRDLFGSPSYPELLAEAAACPAGAHGLVMLPYFSGERTPVADPDARGIIAGLTIQHTRGDLYRAALEATALGVRHNIDAIAAAGGTVERVVAVGGGVQGNLWTQIISDVTGLQQVLPRTTIGASYGAAFLAASAVSDVDIDWWNPPERVVEPRPQLKPGYDELYDLYRSLYAATAPIVHVLAARQHASS